MISLINYTENYYKLYKIVSIDETNFDDEYNYFLIDNDVLVDIKNTRKYSIEYSDESRLNIGDVVEVSDIGRISILYSDAEENCLFITAKCNSNCVMCPSSELARKKDTIPDIDYLMEILKYFPNDTKHLTITGGEPFIIKKDLFKIFSYMKESNKFNNSLLLTNGRAFSIDEYFDLFIKNYPRNMLLGIPLHGSCSEVHDKITKSEGAFKQTTIGISRLLKHNIPIEIRIVPSKLNIGDIDNICDYIVKNFKNVYKVTFISLEMLGNSLINKDKVWISIKEVVDKIEPNIEKLILNGINADLYNFPLCLINQKYINLYKKSITKNKIVYSKKCDGCLKKEICGGMFFSSVKFLENELKPF